ncbi:helix-hairpin-helix domain-containing protein [Marinomonas piezotolerans]|nr:Tex family protein [Marinomonas piezotolerans]
MSMSQTLIKKIAGEFSISKDVAQKIIQLFIDGATVPFIARYRKETTGGMSGEVLREYYNRWQYLVDLEKRRGAILSILKGIPELPKEVFQSIQRAQTKSELEDIYAPYKSIRQSKADLAIEQGLMEFAIQLWSRGNGQAKALYQTLSPRFKKPVSFAETIVGAQEIIIERLSQNTLLINACKQWLFKDGQLVSRVLRGKKESGEKFRDYFDYQEAVQKIPSHRLLALFRGKKESILKLSIEPLSSALPYSLQKVELLTPIGFPLIKEGAISKEKFAWLEKAWLQTLQSKIENDILSDLKNKAERGAIDVFQANLRDLLMAAPAGSKRTLALDPGFRNGVKWAAIDEQGRLLDSGVIFPHPPQNQERRARESITQVLQHFEIEWAVVGNGTASRETEAFVKQVIAEQELSCQCVVVSEAGASVYSASKVAIEEFPDLDVTIRGAISIARRFQDPLAELVKIDPQAIGVGQYQHDVKANRLKQALSDVVEDCVNAVGVDLNLASASLLSYVAGLTERLAQNIVALRDQLGEFTSRDQIKKVKGIGDKAFEQCAGFLRIRNGHEPLDASSVHPESYTLVKQMANSVGMDVASLIGNQTALAKLGQSSSFGGSLAYTYTDIINELAKPGRDPRPEFQYAQFDATISSISDLYSGMTLEGVITNVAAFGAFVDIGVHQDGLVHISQLANRFVKDPRDEVKVGEVVKVEVLEVDEKRKRIALKRVTS